MSLGLKRYWLVMLASDFLVVQWLRLPSSAGGVALILTEGLEAKRPKHKAEAIL